MITKSSLSKKLASYSILTTALLAIDKTTSAQIVYHDVNPDFTVTTPPGDYFLDLNGDGNYDFHFSCSLTHYTTLYGSTKSEIIVENYAYNANLFNPKPRSQSSIIKSSLVNSYLSDLAPNNWNNTANKYMPLKLSSGGKTYMGWVRLDVTIPGVVLSVKDYAYNLTPSDSIIMGDIGCKYIPVTPVISVHSSDTLVSTPATKYQWYFAGTPLSADTTQSVIPTQYGVYSVITTDTGGCKTQSDAINFIPCNSAHLHISSYFNDTTCGNNNFAYLSIDSLPYGYTDVQWYRNDTAVTSNLLQLYYMQEINSSTNFFVVYSNPLTQCVDTSNTLNFVINTPPPSPNVAQHQDTLITTVKGNYTYTWYNYLDSLIVGATGNYYIPTTYNYLNYYTLVITDKATGCTSSEYFYYDPCYYIPDAIIASGDALGCRVDSITLQSFSYTGLTYNWLIDTSYYYGQQAIAGATDSVYNATKAGTYYFIISDDSTYCNVHSNPYIITEAFAPATPSIFISNDTLYTGIYYSYQWYINNDSIAGATSRFYIENTDGSYTVDVTNAAGCSIFSAPYLISTTGDSALPAGELVKVYTNDNDIYVNFLTQGFLNGKIELLNVEGQQLQQRIVTGNTEIINAQQLPKGIYFISINKNEVRRIFKVVLL